MVWSRLPSADARWIESVAGSAHCVGPRTRESFSQATISLRAAGHSTACCGFGRYAAERCDRSHMPHDQARCRLRDAASRGSSPPLPRPCDDEVSSLLNGALTCLGNQAHGARSSGVTSCPRHSSRTQGIPHVPKRRCLWQLVSGGERPDACAEAPAREPVSLRTRRSHQANIACGDPDRRTLRGIAGWCGAWAQGGSTALWLARDHTFSVRGRGLVQGGQKAAVKRQVRCVAL